MKFKEQAIRQSTKIVSLPAIYYQRCDKAIFNHLIIKTMIRLNVFIQVSAENRAAVLESAKELVAYSLKDNGCIAYDVFESATRSDVLMICETWKDAESLSAHEKADHFVALVPKIQGLAAMKLEKFEF